METIEKTDVQTPQEPPREPSPAYTPRPRWQIWGARIGLVIFLLFVIAQLLQIAGGGR